MCKFMLLVAGPRKLQLCGVLDTGCGILGAECRVWDAGQEMESAGCRVLDAECEMQGVAGLRISSSQPI